MTLEVGQVVDGKFRIGRLIGQGGMGEVYEAIHEQIDRRVAIKVVRPSENLRQAMPWFEREARAAGRIGNDHILEVLDVGELPNGARYLVTEYLDGETLEARLAREGQLAPGEAARMAVELLDGLGAAHRAGVIHRDLKPANIFLLKRKLHQVDFVKIIDFGISKFQLVSSDAACNVTATLAVVGTPAYLSPEQARGSSELDGRSDLFVVGAILYEAVTGRRPFEADNINDLMFKIVLEDPVRAEQIVPNLDAKFADIAHKAMARSPEDRYQTAEQMLEALMSWAKAVGIPLTFLAAEPAETRPPQALLSPPGPGSNTVPASLPVRGGDTLSIHPAAKSQDPARPKRLLLLIGGALVAAVLIVAVSMLLGRESAPEITGDAVVPDTTADEAKDEPSDGVVRFAEAVSRPLPSSLPAGQPEPPRASQRLDTGQRDVSGTRPRRVKPANGRSSAAEPRPKRTTPASKKESEWGY